MKLPPFKDYKSKNYLGQSKVSLFIYQFGESKILESKTKQVNPKSIKSKSFQKKIKYIKSCLKKYRKITGLGRGLAAPQIGIAEKFFIVQTKDRVMVAINPKIIRTSTVQLIYPEMCMSAYPVAVNLQRPSWIEFEYLDEFGNIKLWDKKDNTKQNIILNRVFQHEIDHLDGIVNITKAESVNDLIFVSNPNFFKEAKFVKV